MQMTYEQAMRPGMLQAFANRRGSGYMMRSEKRTGSRNGSNRRPPRKRAGFFYIFITLLLCLILWPVGMVMLWRRKVRLQAGTKLLISLLTLCLSVFLIVFALTVPINNPEFTAFQDRANDWLDQAASNIAAAGDSAYRKSTETWQIMSDFSKAGADLALTKTADLMDKGIDVAGKARLGVEKLLHGNAPAATEAPQITDAPEITVMPATDAPKPTPSDAPHTDAPSASPAVEAEAGGIDIHLPGQAPDVQTAQPLAAGTLHADGSFTPDGLSENAVSAPEATKAAEPEVWTPVEDVTEAPAEAATEAPAEAPAEAATEAPAGEPAEAATEAPAEAPTEAATEAPAGEPAEAATEAPAGEPTEAATVAPAEEPAEAATEAPAQNPLAVLVENTEAPDGDGVMVPVEPTPEAPNAAVKPASAATVYYFKDGSKGFHVGAMLHGMNNAPAHTLAEAFADGKTPCKSCGMPDKDILSEENIAWLDENQLIHTTDECAAFAGDWQLIPLAEAVEAGYAACPDCGADAYVESVFPSPTATPAPEVVTPSVPLKSAGEIIVYYFDASQGYHVDANCKGMTNAPAHTLAEAVEAGKRACGNCKPVSGELIGLPVLWLDENDVCHTSDECASFSGKFKLLSRDDALAQALDACPDCGAAEYLIPGTLLAE
ncbi:MAG: hypothetical protein IJ124_09825 [Clostridia bacterium]|nr:hypothetical protein [Clostridia bacterium]